jgi:hypothetical protein
VEEAPICHSLLWETFGYNADSSAGDEVLEGSYVYENNFEKYTQDICQEVARIWEVITEKLVDEIIWGGDWGKFWSHAWEETSSSESGLHFGHYKSGASSAVISHFHAMKASVTLKTGYGLDRWERGLLVMLEKIPGCQLINILRLILLIEADFNSINKILFGIRMLNMVQLYGFMPDEIFSERNCMAEEGTLSKVLFYDVVRQTRSAAGISSVDEDNCYDRVSHAIASLVFCSFGASKEANGTMLKTIQEMIFFSEPPLGTPKTLLGR